jgi:hypothetical protein
VKTEGQVRQQFKQVAFRHRKKLVRRAISRLPSNCRHNRELDIGGVPPVGFCSLLIEDADTFQGVLCDGRHDPELVKTCPSFKPGATAEEIKEGFRSLVENPERGVLALEYPDLAALLWVLDDDDVVPEVPDESAEEILVDLDENPVENVEDEPQGVEEGEGDLDDPDVSESPKRSLWKRVTGRS